MLHFGVNARYHDAKHGAKHVIGFLTHTRVHTHAMVVSRGFDIRRYARPGSELLCSRGRSRRSGDLREVGPEVAAGTRGSDTS